jgi:hypothetical protein
MALPILGLRVRLKGDAAQKFTVRVQATFTDGTTSGPVDGSRTCEAETLAPLEAFQIEILPVETARSVGSSAAAGPRQKPVAPRGIAAKPAAVKPAPAPAPSAAKTAQPKGAARKPASPTGRRR